MEAEFLATFKATLEKGFNLFLGSGFSILAADAKNKNLPLGNNLKIELLDIFKGCLNPKVDYSLTDLSTIATIIESKRPEELDVFLRNRFKVDKFDVRYKSIVNLNVKSVFTTNIDNLIHSIYQDSTTQYINDRNLYGPTFYNKQEIPFYPLHGSIIGDYSLKFTRTELANVFSKHPDGWRVLIDQMKRWPTVFWGHSIKDPGVLATLDELKNEVKRGQIEIWVVIRPEDVGSAEEESLRSLGFKCVVATTDELLKEIAAIKISDNTVVTGAASSFLTQFHVPVQGKTQERPLKYFFLGATPTWSDIYRNLHRTFYFSKITEELNKGNNVAIVGMPASGKTTLLMQIAAGYAFDGVKLYIEQLNLGLAELIVKNLAGQKAIVFVDRFSDQIEAFCLLQNQQNIKVVGAERDYNYDAALHKIASKLAAVYVNELSDADMRGIHATIPPEMRRGGYVVPEVAEGKKPSVFELVAKSIKEHTLAERFKKVLHEIRDKNWQLYELLVVSTYVHWCRTLISFDMLYAFFREEISDYKGVYAIVEQLDPMIVDYVRPYDMDENQDFYTLRSFALFDLVISAVPPEDLQRVIEKFHRQIAPSRIFDFRTFKRRGFDSHIIGRAFDLRAGKEFYERAIEADNTPYLKQHYALFLMKKSEYQNALRLIDIAKSQSGGRVFSINNSYAVILFKAYLSSSDPDALVHLDESMGILEKCYNSDRRTSYHAIDYAKQAIEYRGKYSTTKATAYLSQAKTWLAEDMDNRPREKTRLIREIARLLEDPR